MIHMDQPFQPFHVKGHVFLGITLQDDETRGKTPSQSEDNKLRLPFTWTSSANDLTPD
jgi:hypothetical protein